MLEVLLTLFVFGGFWFWGLLGLASLLLILFLENEKGSYATVMFLSVLAILLSLGNANWATWILQHPVRSLLFVASYLGVGVVYGIAKWWLYVQDAATRYREMRNEWLRQEIESRSDKNVHSQFMVSWQKALQTGVLDSVVLKEWKKYLKQYYNMHPYRRSISKPQAVKNKGRIVSWMTFWVWSGLWTLINDPVRRFFNWAYQSLSGTLQRMSDRAFDGINGE
jgi:hypothetical protein